VHAPLHQQPLGDADVSLRPGAARTAMREPLPIGRRVAAARLAVDPTVAERLVECLIVGETCRCHGALLGEDEPDTGRVGVMLVEPLPPRSCIGEGQFRRISRHDSPGIAIIKGILAHSLNALEPQ